MPTIACRDGKLTRRVWETWSVYSGFEQGLNIWSSTLYRSKFGPVHIGWNRIKLMLLVAKSAEEAQEEEEEEEE